MESVNDPMSFLFLPPEIRLLIYRYLLISKERHISIYRRCGINYGNIYPLGSEGKEVEYLDPLRDRMVKGVIKEGEEWIVTVSEAQDVPCSVLPMFLCNSTIYREAAEVFFSENAFLFSIRQGEKDWDNLYRWLERIGRHNICRLKHVKIEYYSLDGRIRKGKQRFTAKAPYRFSGAPATGPPFSNGLWLYEGSEWFEVISPTIEKVFRKLGCSDSPLLVTMMSPHCRVKLVPRLLYPGVDLQKYDPLPSFNPFSHKKTSLQEWDYDQTCARYSPKEFCMVPDLIEAYRRNYGKDTLTVQWEGSQSGCKWNETKDLLLGCRWEILHWEKEEECCVCCGKPEVCFTLRLERDLTHGYA
jgi:hypothetical protein